MKHYRTILYPFLVVSLIFLAGASHALAGASAGYSEYYIPGDEDSMMSIFEEAGGGTQNNGEGMHAIITVTAWTDNTTVYYDHWEDGYDFDPDDPGTADETYTLAARGDSRLFEDSNIPIPRTTVAVCDVSSSTETYRDEFNAQNYSGSNGTLGWSTDWIEEVDFNGLPDEGEIQVVTDTGVTPNELYAFYIEDNDAAIARMADLSGATTAVLSFDYRRESLNAANDYVRVQVCADAVAGNPITCGSGWTTVVDIGGDVPDDVAYINYQVDLSTLLADIDTANFAVRFSTTGVGSGHDGGDFVYFDNVQIEADITTRPCYYDGRDRIFVAGGTTTVSRASWTEMAGPNQSLAWEVYPVRPQLTKYILPFGEDLPALGLTDFDRVFALIQATSDNTTVTFDLDGDGVTGDTICTSREPSPGPCTTTATQVTLNAGEVFLLDQDVSWPTSTTLDTGSTAIGSDTLQVHYVIGDEGTTYEIRGLSAFPRGFWDDEYYAPVNSAAAATGDPTDIYLHNPHTTNLTIEAQTRDDATGNPVSYTFTLTPGETVSFQAETGSYVPENYSVYLKGDDVFWGVSTVDAEGTTHDWGYSLVPAFLLESEHFMGWAPSTYPLTAGYEDDAGIFISPAQDNITVFIDFDNDGTADRTYNLDSLETQYVADDDPATGEDDGDVSDAHIWATGPYAIAYGQNPDFSATSNPTLDVGYTTIPGTDFIETVMTLDKTANPAIVGTGIGEETTFTLEVNSYDFSVDNISIVDTLPAGWVYVDDSTLITLADQTTIPASGVAGNDADPDINGSVLTWSQGSPVLYTDAKDDMGANQTITITFKARTNQVFTGGDYSRNLAEAVGSRTVGGVTQTFNTSGSAFVLHSDSAMTVVKTSNANTPLYPGDTFTYTVTVTNTSTSGDLTGVAIYDPLPNGVSYVAGTSHITINNAVPVDVDVNDPPNFVTKDDNYTIENGAVLTLTFDVTVDDPLDAGIDEITNTAYVNSNELPLSTSGEKTNIVVIPSSSSAIVEGSVWFDENGDGTKDVGETGLSNVEVTLKDEYGTPVAVTTTDGSGDYQFSGITPGNGYYVEVTGGIPAGLIQSAPSGHTDDRTDPFDLVAGQTYADTNADLGYKSAPGSATLGDLVWSDADGDGIRDPGEPGLEGITVELWEDIDGDGLLEPAGDDAVQTNYQQTITGAGGSYLFTGVPASGSEDYFVLVDGSQAALADYTLTTSDPFYFQDVAAGDVLLSADFGFENTAATPSAHTISDRVWYDPDGDGYTTGDGIGGVTVDLLDDSLNVIATTTTDADGLFTFSGVPGNGADYTVQITDTGGVLDDYYGVSAEAVAGSMEIINLSGDLDYSASPNFEYGLAQSISGTVFKDNDDDGDQDAVFSGVTVKLYTDTFGGSADGSISGETLVATVTTDSSGNYVFSGLVEGNDYIISIEDPPGAPGDYTFLSTDTDGGAAGDQLQGTVPVGGSADIDFRYQPVVQKIETGTVWNDADQDGIIDVGEAGFEDVTIEIYLDDGDSTFEMGTDDIFVDATITDANGDYGFNGLPAGVYWIVVTDDLGVLAGLDNTVPATDWEQTDLGPGNNNNVINFGYYNPTPTLAVISSFKAYEDNGQVIVEWKTTSEVGTLGFYLFRKEEDTGKYLKLNETLLPGLIVSRKGGTYTYVDETAVSGETYTYKLVEVEARGSRHTHGPFEVTVNGPGIDVPPAKINRYVEKLMNKWASPRKVSEKANMKRRSARKPLHKRYNRKMRRISKNEKDRRAARRSVRQAFQELKKQRRGDALKIMVVDSGLYYLSASEIAEKRDVPEARINKLIRHNRLSLSNQGQPVAWTPAENDTGIYFYGEAVDSIYTTENVYWLKKGRGLRMALDNGGEPEVASGFETFVESIHREEDHWPLIANVDDPATDYWFWDYIYSGYHGLDVRTYTVRSDGVDPAGSATLTLYLQAWSDTPVDPDHHVKVSVNGTEIIDEYWDGIDPLMLNAEVDASLLFDGENRIKITGVLDTGTSYSLFYIDGFDLTYERYFQAKENRLRFTADGNASITVGGFTGPEISVFDITDPEQPALVENTLVEDTGIGYRISFSPASPYGEYLALPLGIARAPVSIVADEASSLKQENNQADYLVIVPPELQDAAQELADFRQANGLATLVVDLEDIMDEFNHGLFSPEAIRGFLSYAYHRWEGAPKYVVLAGEGTFDYRDLQGHGDNMVPPMMVSTPYGLFASDNRLADVQGNDGVPEMAVGRLPVMTPAELEQLINKIIDYEIGGGGEWTRRILFLADDPDAGGNFPADSDDIADLLPLEYTSEFIYLYEQDSTETARRAVQVGINEGALFVNYIGHGGLDRLAAEGMLRTGDVSSLINDDRLPVLLALTCVTGRFSLPGYDALSEALLLHDGGGAAAVWSPTGLSFNAEAKILNQGFFRSAFGGKNQRLGDMVLDALAGYGQRGTYAYMPYIYTLLGDPALEIHR